MTFSALALSTSFKLSLMQLRLEVLSIDRSCIGSSLDCLPLNHHQSMNLVSIAMPLLGFTYRAGPLGLCGPAENSVQIASCRISGAQGVVQRQFNPEAFGLDEVNGQLEALANLSS